MRAINNPDVLERTAVRSDVGAVAISLIGYLIITSFASVIMIFFANAKFNGVIYPAASGAGLFFIWLILRGNLHLGEIFEETREIPARVMRNAFFCIAGLQPVFMFIGHGVTKLFEYAGYSVDLSSFDPASEGVVFIIINLVVVKPVIEGILFRGVCLRVLSAYGRTFAIVASAILFGLYQGNILQIGYALCAGLILGYITFRYSIKYSIILHAVHNGLMVLVAYVTPLAPAIAVYAMWSVFVVGLIVVAVTKHAKVYRFLDAGRARANAWRYTFTVPWLLLYIAITIALTVVQLDIKSLDAPGVRETTQLIPEIWKDLAS
ncbi:MAG: CPBP family intramembrane metalloprotease [Clostridiales Family XIII bacterium]|jgi:hypothetical protein|nr:CPBP family intramembrane metalloprotease [Clostridiales Family XIII bacterium]